MEQPTREPLTEEEVSALLSNPNSGDKTDSKRRIVPYNFRRPDRISKEQVRSLYLLHDNLANNLSSRIPLFLRSACEVSLISVEQQSYSEYLKGLPNPSVLFTINMYPLPGSAIFEINPSVAFPVIDRQLGGIGEPLAEARGITEIEQKILDGFVRLVLTDFCEVWQPIVEFDLDVIGCETRPQLSQIVAPNEVVISVVLHVRIGETRGAISFCLPAITLEPILPKLNQSFYSRINNVPAEQTRSLIEALSMVNLPVAAELHGTTMTIQEILSISPGDVLRLKHRVDEPIEVSVGGVVKFRGDLINRNKRTVVVFRSLVQQGDPYFKDYAQRD